MVKVRKSVANDYNCFSLQYLSLNDSCWLNESDKPKQKIQRELFIELTDEEKVLVNLLKGQTKLGIDTICLESKLTSGKVANVLLNLEFKGVVKSLPGKMYELLQPLIQKFFYKNPRLF